MNIIITALYVTKGPQATHPTSRRLWGKKRTNEKRVQDHRSRTYTGDANEMSPL